MLPSAHQHPLTTQTRDTVLGRARSTSHGMPASALAGPRTQSIHRPAVALQYDLQCCTARAVSRAWNVGSHSQPYRPQYSASERCLEFEPAARRA